MISIEKTGKTVDKAVEVALKELRVTKDNVTIDILEEPNKKMMGIFGGKNAKVRVTIKESMAEKAKKFLEQVLDNMKISAIVDIVEEKGKYIKLEIHGKNMGLIIGHRGQTLDALQYLTSLVINKGKEEYKKIIVDTENYRKKREEALVNLANKLADKVRTTKRKVILEPMNPYERRIMHSALQDNSYVKTHSEGDEPNRKVIISIK